MVVEKQFSHPNEHIGWQMCQESGYWASAVYEQDVPIELDDTLTLSFGPAYSELDIDTLKLLYQYPSKESLIFSVLVGKILERKGESALFRGLVVVSASNGPGEGVTVVGYNDRRPNQFKIASIYDRD